MNRGLFITLVLLTIIVGTVLGNYLLNPPAKDNKAYYLTIDEVTDTITIMTITDELGEYVMIIDDDISRHGRCTDTDIINALETQIGWESPQLAADAYYNLIWNVDRGSDITW